jgi:NAD(P)-dependent dehydrogenase (short-subunit alcohol dehydrogenase family)
LLITNTSTVHIIDRLPSPVEDPDSEFPQIAKRAKDLGTSLHYHHADVGDVPDLDRIVEDIANGTGRLDSLIAGAGINHETPAIDYSMEETERMMSINFTGAFVTAQAAW